jgi:prolyl oligopeptidase
MRRQDLVEHVHGVPVADPYRWLEDGASEEVQEYTRRENERTRAHVAAIPGEQALRARLRELLRIGWTGAPAVRKSAAGERVLFFTRRDSDAPQPVLVVRDAAGERVLLDPAGETGDETAALDWWYPSPSGRYVAYGTSRGGDELSTLRVREVATGRDLEDRIARTQHASVAWVSEERFFYTRYPVAGAVPQGEESYHHRVREHVLGADPEADPVVFGDGRPPEDVLSVVASPNGRFLVVRVHRGWDKSELWVRDLQSGGPFVAVSVGQDALFEPLPQNDRLLVLSNHRAPRWRVLEASWERPTEDAWRVLVPESEDVLTQIVTVNGHVVCGYLRDASARVVLYPRQGAPKELELPFRGSVSLAGEPHDDELFATCVSFATPTSVLAWTIGADGSVGPRRTWAPPATALSLPDVEVELWHATSRDGTRVPFFVVHAGPLPTDGSAAAILYGYGGFNVNQTPAFSVRALAAVERGVVWVACVLRGGGELGEEWHRAGMLSRKQNVFDDYFACAEELVRRGVTMPERMGALGGSNGGLLVCAAITQRPELFRAAVALVPLTDMLRYPRFRIGKLWIPEYGDPDDPAHFPFLLAYSPYHAVRSGTRYPSVLLTSAEGDSRVDPMHARKMAARLREEERPDRPVLLRVETEAGHGQGKPVTRLAESLADELAFLLDELGVPLDGPRTDASEGARP